MAHQDTQEMILEIAAAYGYRKPDLRDETWDDYFDAVAAAQDHLTLAAASDDYDAFNIGIALGGVRIA
jgi:hypothetical protein